MSLVLVSISFSEVEGGRHDERANIYNCCQVFIVIDKLTLLRMHVRLYAALFPSCSQA